MCNLLEPKHIDDEAIFQQVGIPVANVDLICCHERFDLTVVPKDVDHVLVGELRNAHRVDRWRWLERSPTQLGQDCRQSGTLLAIIAVIF